MRDVLLVVSALLLGMMLRTLRERLRAEPHCDDFTENTPIVVLDRHNETRAN